MSGSLEERVAKLEHDQQEMPSEVSSHFIELRAYFGDTLRSQLAELEARLEKRFSRIDERFSRIDERLGTIDGRLTTIDQRFDRLESKLDVFIETQGGINRRQDRRLGAVERKLRTPRRRKD